LLVVWFLDVIWWWRGLAGYAARPKIIAWCIQGFLAFMWFNATVVFGHGWIRWSGLSGFAVIAFSYGQKRRRRDSSGE
jgi:hypothetical protein